MPTPNSLIDYLGNLVRAGKRLLECVPRVNASKVEKPTCDPSPAQLSYERRGCSEMYSVTSDIRPCNFRMKAVLRRNSFNDKFTIEYVREDLPLSA